MGTAKATLNPGSCRRVGSVHDSGVRIARFHVTENSPHIAGQHDLGKKRFPCPSRLQRLFSVSSSRPKSWVDDSDPCISITEQCLETSWLAAFRPRHYHQFIAKQLLHIRFGDKALLYQQIDGGLAGRQEEIGWCTRHDLTRQRRLSRQSSDRPECPYLLQISGQALSPDRSGSRRQTPGWGLQYHHRTPPCRPC